MWRGGSELRSLGRLQAIFMVASMRLVAVASLRAVESTISCRPLMLDYYIICGKLVNFSNRSMHLMNFSRISNGNDFSISFVDEIINFSIDYRN